MLDFFSFQKCTAQSIARLIFLCVGWSMTGHRLVPSGQREKARCLREAHRRTTLTGLVRKTHSFTAFSPQYIEANIVAIPLLLICFYNVQILSQSLNFYIKILRFFTSIAYMKTFCQ